MLYITKSIFPENLRQCNKVAVAGNGARTVPECIRNDRSLYLCDGKIYGARFEMLSFIT